MYKETSFHIATTHLFLDGCLSDVLTMHCNAPCSSFGRGSFKAAVEVQWKNGEADLPICSFALLLRLQMKVRI